jgi:hypothetical protein
MTAWKDKFDVLFKTFKWFIFTLVVGLSPVFIPWGFSYIVQSDITFKKIIMDGALLFFSTTIVSSMLIDYYQSQKIPDINSWAGILFFGTPFFIFMVCLSFFSLVYARPRNKLLGLIF